MSSSLFVVLTFSGMGAELLGLGVLGFEVTRAVSATRIIEQWRARLRSWWRGGDVQEMAGADFGASFDLQAKGTVQAPEWNLPRRMRYLEEEVRALSAEVDAMQRSVEAAAKARGELSQRIDDVPKLIAEQQRQERAAVAGRLVIGTLLVALGTALSAVANVV